MCERGRDSILVRVKISADMSRTGKTRWAWKQIDECIAPIVKALQEGGIDMRGCCCGHGDAPGSILLQDKRTLRITKD